MLKRTRQKAVILRVLSGNRFHPTAIWIYDEVRKELPRVSLGTVYRNLRHFCELGEITVLELSAGLSRFDIRTDMHHHFWCNSCDRIFDIDIPAEMRISDRLSGKAGFRVSDYRLLLRGLCPDCQPEPTGEFSREAAE